MGKTRIFLADDHAIMREGLRYIISKENNLEVAGEAGDGREAFEMIERIKPDIAVLDISMPSMTGVEISRQLCKYHPEIKIIILSRHDNPEYVQTLLQYGISGYVLKEGAGNELIMAITEVLKGNIYLSPKVVTMMVTENTLLKSSAAEKDRNSRSSDDLTHREKEILKLIAEGKSNSEIAGTLFISEKTVKTHRGNIMKKLGIKRLADLVKYAVRIGLIEM